MEKNGNDRYSRQIILKDFGPEAQQKLEVARVLIIGAGGLGCPVLMYLTAAGVGTIGVADGDKVELNNLHRQILYDTNDIGLSKVRVASSKMKLKNPEVKIVTHDCFVSTANVFDLLACYDLIVDATDNFSSRYMISDACHLMKKPLVYGAVSCYEGQVGVFNFNPKGKAVNYRDLFPVPPAPGEANSCTTEGVLGVLPGIIGLMQANEVIKILAGVGIPLVNKLFTIDISDYRTFEMEVSPGVHSGMPGSVEEFMRFDYDSFCSANSAADMVIDASTLKEWMLNEEWSIIDVREKEEVKENDLFSSVNVPLSTFKTEIENVTLAENVIFVCASGVRSRLALDIAKNIFPERKLFSLREGVQSLINLEFQKEN
jgi:molybdopterin/thiamine biosynthesis adenylyltransferase/rhodanese-related sulfurtransferase